MGNEELVYELIEALNNLKKSNINCMHPKDKLSNNERMVLFIIHNVGSNNRISLSIIRDKIKLAPSTITPIITSLEKRGLIERKIDTKDRRNIYIYLSSKGEKFTKQVDIELKNILNEYIKYIGDEDTKKLIYLINKTKKFMEKKKGENNV